MEGGGEDASPMNYWFVKFASYNGHGTADAWFETESTALTVFNEATESLAAAQEYYRLSGKEQAWIGKLFSVTDCFGSKFTFNLSNHAIMFGSLDACEEGKWKTRKSSKDAEDKYKPLYEDGAMKAIGS
jgi:hypothetical protein